MRSIVGLSLFLLIIGCKHTNKKQSNGLTDSFIAVSDSNTEEHISPQFHKEIFIDVFEKRNIIIKNPEEKYEVLLALFPGMIAVDSNDQFEVYEDSSVVWFTKNHSTRNVWDYDYNDSISFPFEDGNETQFEHLFYFSKHNVRYCAFFYSTYTCNYPWVFDRNLGRSHPAVWGVSIFQKTNNGWLLTAHQPAFANINSNEPQKVALDNANTGVLFDTDMSGAGVSMSSYLIYSLGDSIKPIINESAFDFCIDYNVCYAKKNINIDKKNRQITFTSAGVICVEIIDSGYFDVIDTSLLYHFEDKSKTYRFRYTKTYTANSDNTYTLTKTNISKKIVPPRKSY